MNINVRSTLFFLITCFIFQAAFSLGKFNQKNLNVEKSISSIEKRIALDLPKLKLANPRFKTVAHEASVKEYLQSLNTSLSSLEAPIRVITLQGIGEPAQPSTEVIRRNLQTIDQLIEVELIKVYTSPFSYFTLVVPLFAFIVTLLRVKQEKLQAAKLAKQPEVIEPPKQAKLIINLHDKSISNGLDDKRAPLSNKPFCFYAALVDYCLQQENPSLNHNKNVPDDLLHLANKYFYRLIELGHTKRKRPDFSTNLDKTLSEVRSSLDEVFHDYADAKDIFYPPKAQGEGSRSKMHNYALEHITQDQVVILGK